jgi:Ribbon-helix-helix protein, copG family
VSAPQSVRLDPFLHKRLEQAAAREGITPSAFIRRAIEERAERILGEPSALDWLGEYVGSLTDVPRVEPRDTGKREDDDFAAFLEADLERQRAGLSRKDWPERDKWFPPLPESDQER